MVGSITNCQIGMSTVHCGLRTRSCYTLPQHQGWGAARCARCHIEGHHTLAPIWCCVGQSGEHRWPPGPQTHPRATQPPPPCPPHLVLRGQGGEHRRNDRRRGLRRAGLGPRLGAGPRAEGVGADSLHVLKGDKETGRSLLTEGTAGVLQDQVVCYPAPPHPETHRRRISVPALGLHPTLHCFLRCTPLAPHPLHPTPHLHAEPPLHQRPARQAQRQRQAVQRRTQLRGLACRQVGADAGHQRRGGGGGQRGDLRGRRATEMRVWKAAVRRAKAVGLRPLYHCCTSGSQSSSGCCTHYKARNRPGTLPLQLPPCRPPAPPR